MWRLKEEQIKCFLSVKGHTKGTQCAGEHSIKMKTQGNLALDQPEAEG